MSLDALTLEWLEKRRGDPCEVCKNHRLLFCSMCARKVKIQEFVAADFFSLSGCDLRPDYRDAAEFEARVAAKLAEEGKTYFFMHVMGYAPESELRLKYARLAVEAEMEHAQ